MLLGCQRAGTVYLCLYLYLSYLLLYYQAGGCVCGEPGLRPASRG